MIQKLKSSTTLEHAGNKIAVYGRTKLLCICANELTKKQRIQNSIENKKHHLNQKLI